MHSPSVRVRISIPIRQCLPRIYLDLVTFNYDVIVVVCFVFAAGAVLWSRTAASALISGLAPENLGWLAQYFLDQLVGWGLAPPEETDSEVMALVAPAGDKGRATLQKLHRRISTPSTGEVRGLNEDSTAVLRRLNGVSHVKLVASMTSAVQPRFVLRACCVRLGGGAFPLYVAHGCIYREAHTVSA